MKRSPEAEHLRKRLYRKRARPRAERPGEIDYPKGMARATARVAAGLSQRQLSKLVGVSQVIILKWENGQSDPQGRLRQRYFAILASLLPTAIKKIVRVTGPAMCSARTRWTLDLECGHRRFIYGAEAPATIGCFDCE